MVKRYEIAGEWTGVTGIDVVEMVSASDYDALAARLAEATDVLANGKGVSPDTHANRMHAALAVLNGAADSASGEQS